MPGDTPLLVIGCGSIGARHARNARTLGCTHIRCFDPDTARRDALAAELEAEAFGELDSALAGNGLALVCSPPVLHLEHAQRAADAGWDLLIEKPLAVSTEGVEKLAATVRELELVALVGFNLRFEPGLLRVRELLASGELGRPLAVRAVAGQYLPDWHPWEDYRRGYSAHRNLGGGVLLDFSHELDLLSWLFGDPERVWCQAATSGELELDVDDVAQLSFVFPGGVLAQLQVDYLQRAPRRELEVACADGTIRWRYDERRLDVFRAGADWETQPLRHDHNETYVDELRHLLDAIATRSETRCTIEEGARSLRVIERARASTEAG